jgi:hypothetical protein
MCCPCRCHVKRREEACGGNSNPSMMLAYLNERYFLQAAGLKNNQPGNKFQFKKVLFHPMIKLFLFIRGKS